MAARSAAQGGVCSGAWRVARASQSVSAITGTGAVASAIVARELGLTGEDTEIITTGWYDYDAKYRPGGSRHVIPAEIPDGIAAACRDYAVRAHQVLGCQGLSRSDFRWDESRGLAGLIILETNTQPGMTATSLAPEQAAYNGMDFPALCRWIVEEALCRA